MQVMSSWAKIIVQRLWWCYIQRTMSQWMFDLFILSWYIDWQDLFLYTLAVENPPWGDCYFLHNYGYTKRGR